MIAIAAALIAAFVPQDEARLKEAWPKLAEAWKAVEEYKAPPDVGALDDEYLKVIAKVHGAFEGAGLYTLEGEYLPQAVKAFVKMRARGLAPASVTDMWSRTVVLRARLRGAPGAPGAMEPAGAVQGDPMSALLASLKKLQSLKTEGLDDEENVQDELTTARKSLKALGITADDTLPALRRRVLHLVRALALGEVIRRPRSRPKSRRNSSARSSRNWATSRSKESREGDEEELSRAGEASLPFIREALKAATPRSRRAKALLGVGRPVDEARLPKDRWSGASTSMALPRPRRSAPAKGRQTQVVRNLNQSRRVFSTLHEDARPRCRGGRRRLVSSRPGRSRCGADRPSLRGALGRGENRPREIRGRLRVLPPSVARRPRPPPEAR
jgi:hypothetical protein